MPKKKKKKIIFIPKGNGHGTSWHSWSASKSAKRAKKEEEKHMRITGKGKK